MNCQNCGSYIKRRDTYCPHCGEELKSSEYKSHNKDYKKSEFDHHISRKNSGYKPGQKKNTEYKPLQKRFIRGDYQDHDDDFYNHYIEEQFIDGPAYEKPRKKKYRGYDLSEYYPDEEESSGIGMLPIILILLIALLIGFIIGIMMFSNSSLPSVG